MSAKPYAVVRAATIQASPRLVRDHLEDLRGWRHWSPWPPLRETTEVRHAGPARGTGARMEWDDDPRVGSGHLELVESPDSIVIIDMDSERPRSSGNVMVFLLDATAGGTRLTWTMHGEVEGLRKLFALVWPMGKAVGPGFARGLVRLKEIIEGDRS